MHPPIALRCSSVLEQRTAQFKSWESTSCTACFDKYRVDLDHQPRKHDEHSGDRAVPVFLFIIGLVC